MRPLSKQALSALSPKGPGVYLGLFLGVSTSWAVDAIASVETRGGAAHQVPFSLTCHVVMIVKKYVCGWGAYKNCASNIAPAT